MAQAISQRQPRIFGMRASFFVMSVHRIDTDAPILAKDGPRTRRRYGASLRARRRFDLQHGVFVMARSIFDRNAPFRVMDPAIFGKDRAIFGKKTVLRGRPASFRGKATMLRRR